MSLANPAVHPLSGKASDGDQISGRSWNTVISIFCIICNEQGLRLCSGHFARSSEELFVEVAVALWDDVLVSSAYIDFSNAHDRLQLRVEGFEFMQRLLQISARDAEAPLLDD